MKALDGSADFAGRAGVLDGRPDGRPPLVLLHGLTFDRAMWRRLWPGCGKPTPGARCSP